MGSPATTSSAPMRDVAIHSTRKHCRDEVHSISDVTDESLEQAQRSTRSGRPIRVELTCTGVYAPNNGRLAGIEGKGARIYE